MRPAPVPIWRFTLPLPQVFMQQAHKSVVRLSELRSEYGWNRIRSNSICRSPIADQNRSVCEKDLNFLVSLDSLAHTAFEAIDLTLERGALERTSFVRETLNQLPAEYKEVLCKNTLAYSILGDCP